MPSRRVGGCSRSMHARPPRWGFHFRAGAAAATAAALPPTPLCAKTTLALSWCTPPPAFFPFSSLPSRCLSHPRFNPLSVQRATHSYLAAPRAFARRKMADAEGLTPGVFNLKLDIRRLIKLLHLIVNILYFYACSKK